MYTVLLPVDQSEDRARAQAAATANLPAASEDVVATVVHVVGDPGDANQASVTDTDGGRTAVEGLEAAGITVHQTVRAGDPAEEILAAADERNADAVMMGGRKRSPLGSALFGSVSQTVMRETGRPVVVTGEREERETPTHRCRSCGEEYVTSPAAEITTCRNCGGTKVERVTDEEGEAPTA